MSESSSSSIAARFQKRLKEIIESGETVKDRVETEVCQFLHETELDTDGIKTMVDGVLEGAKEGLDKTGPDQRDQRLRDTLDGLADGFGASAQAVQLALDEAKSSGARFTQEDLRRAAQNLKAAGGLFTEILGDTSRLARAELSQQWTQIRQHGQRSWERSKPAVESALKTVAEHPVQTGKDALQKGAQMATHASGALLDEIGKRLQSLGKKLRS